MHVYLVHHAIALGPEVDSQRPLSSVGLAQAAHLAASAAARGVKPGAIWHSGKLRARQTAEAFWRLCHPFAEFKMVRGLRPEDPAEWIRDVLEVEARDVLLVGHMPQLPHVAELLGSCLRFPVNGMVALERVGPRRYEEQWRESGPLL